MVKKSKPSTSTKGNTAKQKAQASARREAKRAENLRQRIRGGDRDAEIEFIRRYHIDPGSIKKA